MSRDFFNRLKNTLIRCGPFESNTNLRTIFVDTRLTQWAMGVPESNNRQDRVELLIFYLHDKRDDHRNSALVLFLQVLCEWIPKSEDCHEQICSLANELMADPNIATQLRLRKLTSFSVLRLDQLIAILLTIIIIGWIAKTISSIYQENHLTRMVHNTNVAVIPFQVSGNIEKTRKRDLAQRYENILENAVMDTVIELEEEHIKSVEIRPPSAFEHIVVLDDQEASQLAESINANIVLYGTIDVQGQGESAAYIQPHIYIASNTFLAEGAEISGSYRLGDKMFVPNLNAENVFETDQDNLQSLLRVLIEVGRGLNFYAEGNFEQAQSQFERVLEQIITATQWQHPDLLYLLLGNCALKQEQFTEAEDYYKQAEVAYQASGGGEKYARALIGLGSIAYSVARGGSDTTRFDNINPSNFENAIQLYQEAILYDMDKDLTHTNIDIKARFGLGQAFLLRGVVEQDLGLVISASNDYTDAEEQFRFIIVKYESLKIGSRSQIAELSSLAYADMGLIAFQRAEFETAANYYVSALSVLHESKWNCTPPITELRQKFDERLLFLYVTKLNDPYSARIWLREALGDRTIHCEDTTLQNWYQNQLDSLEQNEQTGGIGDSKKPSYYAHLFYHPTVHNWL